MADEGLESFLDSAGWSEATRTPLTGDASTRSYQRLQQKEQSAILMIAPPGAEDASCPRDATPEMRRQLGYNAMARLAGPNLHAFVEVAKALRKAGLSAPEIYAADPKEGHALIEDLGDDLYARAVNDVDERSLYTHAIEALVAVRRADIRTIDTPEYALMAYDETAMIAETALLTAWYWPQKIGADVSGNLQAEYNSLWLSALNNLSEPHIIVLRDYHAENLLWLPDRDGPQRAGLIDFQDALFGHAAYDLVSLLEDARRDVDELLAQEMIEKYISLASADSDFDADQFKTDYAILGAQRNAKILGIFARLAKRDNKPRYLDLLPRVEAHFRRDLTHPALAPVAAFFKQHIPDLAP